MEIPLLSYESELIEGELPRSSETSILELSLLSNQREIMSVALEIVVESSGS
jgi:hypothetical protein